MFNMYPMGMMNGGMYGMNGMGSMNGVSGASGNVHQEFKNRYGIGYSDFGTTPYAQPYPMPIVKRAPEPLMEQNWLGRFIRRFFS